MYQKVERDLWDAMLLVRNEAGDIVWNDQLPWYFWMNFVADMMEGWTSGVMITPFSPEVYYWDCKRGDGTRRYSA